MSPLPRDRRSTSCWIGSVLGGTGTAPALSIAAMSCRKIATSRPARAFIADRRSDWSLCRKATAASILPDMMFCETAPHQARIAWYALAPSISKTCPFLLITVQVGAADRRQ
jgi:hypothetical protein